MQILRIAWERWRIIGKVNGDYIGRLTAELFYYTIFVPFALGVQVFSDPLSLKHVPGWTERKPIPGDLDSARSQF